MFKNQLRELIVGRKFTVFSLFYFVFDGTVFKYKPPGAYIQRGHLTKGFLHYGFEGLIFGGAYTAVHGEAYFWKFTKNIID